MYVKFFVGIKLWMLEFIDLQNSMPPKKKNGLKLFIPKKPNVCNLLINKNKLTHFLIKQINNVHKSTRNNALISHFSTNYTSTIVASHVRQLYLCNLLENLALSQIYAG